jgi:hypothetical protein
VAHLEIASSTVELATQQASHISWTPADLGTRVRALLLSGWHFPYAPNAALLCEGPDAQGNLEIPAVLVDGFLAHGNLLNRPSLLMRFMRATLALGDGEIELVVGSVRNLQLILP